MTNPSEPPDVVDARRRALAANLRRKHRERRMMVDMEAAGGKHVSSPEMLGRYAIYDELGSGGMASVFLARMVGEAGFARTVAIKRMHPHLAKERDFVEMFLDEARTCASLRHPNVVSILDVVAQEGQLALVMEYIHGESVSGLLRAASEAGVRPPPTIAIAIMAGVLRGLHAAHEATSDRRSPLGIVHRDVSPQNIVVGVDGLARVLDFGIAKARGRLQTTTDGMVKGKLAYMAPEQIRSETVDARTDVFSACVVLWELLTVRRLFVGENEWSIAERVLREDVKPPSATVDGLPPALDAIVLRGLKRDPDRRFSGAGDLADALEECLNPATTAQVGAWVESLASQSLDGRARLLARIGNLAPGFTTTKVRDVLGSLSPIDPRPDAPEPTAIRDPLALRSQLEEQLRQHQLWAPPPAPAQRSSAGFLLALVIAAIAIVYILTYYGYSQQTTRF